MIFESVHEMRTHLKSAVKVKDDRVEVVDLQKLQDGGIDLLAHSAVFGTDIVKNYARWLIWEIGQAVGARPGQHPRVLHRPRPGQVAGSHRAGHEHPLHDL